MSNGEASLDAEFLQQACAAKRVEDAKTAGRQQLAQAQNAAMQQMQQGMVAAKKCADRAAAPGAEHERDYSKDPLVIAGKASSSTHMNEWKQFQRVLQAPEGIPVVCRPLVQTSKRTAFNAWLEANRDKGRMEINFKRRMVRTQLVKEQRGGVTLKKLTEEYGDDAATISKKCLDAGLHHPAGYIRSNTLKTNMMFLG